MACVVNRITSALLFLLILSGTAFSQGFMVKPMKIEVAGTPGQTVTVDLQISNTHATVAPEVQVEKYIFDQGINGTSIPLTPGELTEDQNDKLRSCYEFLTIEPARMTIPPLQVGIAKISVQIPPNATGTYTALVSVSNVPIKRPGTIAMQIRFLVTVIVDVRGRSARKEIDLTGVSLNFVGEGKDSDGQVVPAKDDVHVNVVNSGEARGTIGGTVTILRKAGAGWRRVSTVEYEEKTVMPGTEWEYVLPSPRRLPSGTYQLSTNFMLDGRKMRPMNATVEYQGDPTVQSVAEDVTLMIEPRISELEGVPGSQRTARIRIQNPSDSQLQVSFRASVPQTLQGVAMGDILGESFSCDEWMTVSPPRFTLRGGGERTIAVRLRFPEEMDKPIYYGTLALAATYPDGEVADATELLIVAKNHQLGIAPHFLPYSLSISQVGDTQYSISSKFGNVGNVHLYPTVEAVVTNSSGLRSFKRLTLESDETLILPLGTPVYNGEFSAADLADGVYKLTVRAEYGEHSADKSIGLNVSTHGTEKRIEVID